MTAHKCRIIVIGNLNIDYIEPSHSFFRRNSFDKDAPLVGGTAYNAAVAFAKRNLMPVIIGSVGDDYEGSLIKAQISSNNLSSVINTDASKPTGICQIRYKREDGKTKRTYIRSPNDANCYSVSFLRYALESLNISNKDIIFSTSDFVGRNSVGYSKEFWEVVRSFGDRIVLDVVPHKLYEKLDIKQFNDIFGSSIKILIAEFKTLIKLLSRNNLAIYPSERDWRILFSSYRSRVIVARYGEGEISKQETRIVIPGNTDIIQKELIETGYNVLKEIDQRGFGDMLTANILSRLLKASSPTSANI